MSIVINELEGFKKALKTANFMSNDIIFNVESDKIILYTCDSSRTCMLEYEHNSIENNNFMLKTFKIYSDVLTRFSFSFNNTDSMIFIYDKDKFSNKIFFGKYFQNYDEKEGLYISIIPIYESKESIRIPINHKYLFNKSIIELNNIYTQFIKQYRLLESEKIQIELDSKYLQFLSEKSHVYNYINRKLSESEDFNIIEFSRYMNYRFPFENIDKLGSLSNNIIMELYNIGDILKALLVFKFRFKTESKEFNELKFLTISYEKSFFTEKDLKNVSLSELRIICEHNRDKLQKYNENMDFFQLYTLIKETNDLFEKRLF